MQISQLHLTSPCFIGRAENIFHSLFQFEASQHLRWNPIWTDGSDFNARLYPTLTRYA